MRKRTAPSFSQTSRNELLASEEATARASDLMVDTLPGITKNLLDNDDRIRGQLSDRAYLVLTQLIARGDLDRALRARLVDNVVDGVAIAGMSEELTAKVRQRVADVAAEIVGKAVETALADLVKAARQAAFKAAADALKRLGETG